MLGCLASGISGLTVNNNNMSIIANNIANISTPGYKLQRANFSDVLCQQFGDLEIGNGVSMEKASSICSQGSLESSSNVTDLAVNGKGYFVLKDSANNVFYTRAGQFHFDKQGNLVSPDGHLVQGWNLRERDSLTDINMSDISVYNLSLSPHATESLVAAVNLDASAEVPTNAFNPDDSDTYNYSTSVSVVDSLGNKHSLNLYFRKADENQWDWHAYSEDGAAMTEQASGSLTFSETGALETESEITYANGTGFDFGNEAAPDQAIAIDFGGSIDEGRSGTSGTTQYSAISFTPSFYQDGYESGSLKSISITKNGIIQGLFSNGQTQDIAQIALADFNNPQGLKQQGNNLFSSNYESGEATVNQAEAGGMGSIHSYNLENSNVDLATEFMKMIITQRAFQANARTITTADQLLTELVSLKR